MKTHPLNTTIIDMKFLDMWKHLLKILLNISPATHESQQLIVRKQIQFRIALSDLNQGASHFPIEFVQLLTDLCEIGIHDYIFADEKDGIVNVVTFYQLPVQFQQIGKERVLELLIDNVVLQIFYVPLLNLKPLCQFLLCDQNDLPQFKQLFRVIPVYILGPETLNINFDVM